MSRRYRYHRKQDLWARHRYTTRRRDGILILVMSVVGFAAVAALVWINLR